MADIQINNKPEASRHPSLSVRIAEDGNPEIELHGSGEEGLVLCAAAMAALAANTGDAAGLTLMKLVTAATELLDQMAEE